MSIEHIVFYVGLLVAFLMIAGVVYWRMPKRLKVDKFEKQWHELQLFCRDKATWRDAVIAADRLLNQALKKRKFAGRSMGERLVAAQKIFTDHYSVWQAHNLYKKLEGNPTLQLKESEVKLALIAFRQALRDLGALKKGSNDKSQGV